MAGNGISSLERPSAGYRIDRAVRENGERFFEIPAAARNEDRFRTKMLRRAGLLDPGERQLANDLADRLEQGPEADDHPNSLASSENLRDLRIRVCGAMWSLYDQVGADRCAVVHLVPKDGFVPAGELHLVDPRVLKERLRASLNRAGAATVSGGFIAFLHGEYDSRRDGYLLHWHGFATDEMIDVAAGLREQANFRADRGSREMLDGQVWTPVLIQRGPFANPAYRLSYLFKSYWPYRPTILTDDGKVQRVRTVRRVPEPEHSRHLLWLDRWRLEDVTLMVKMRLVDGQLCIRSPSGAYTNGSE